MFDILYAYVSGLFSLGVMLLLLKYDALAKAEGKKKMYFDGNMNVLSNLIRE